MISLIIPYIDQFDVLVPAIDTATQNAKAPFELVLIDNGSAAALDIEPDVSIRNEHNIGVLQTFKQGYENAKGDILLFIHSDVLIHSDNWVAELETAFERDSKLGLAGFFGARAIGEDGGRMDSMSNMLGKVWGKCDCHPIAGYHHGRVIKDIQAATVLDGLGMAFRREAMKRLIEETDMFAQWRSLHHFYDKILSLKVIGLGYHVAVVPMEFDHFSGATAVRSKAYPESVRDWLRTNNIEFKKGHEDQAIYDLAEKQMFDEYRDKFPITVDASYNYFSRGAPYVQTA